MTADVPVGAFLSGGVDSSAIVSTAGRVARDPIATFSITFPGLEEFDESAYAAAVASHCHAHHQEFNLTPNLIEGLPQVAWHADEPFAISSAFALFFLARLARQHVKVVLTGDGGDEVFAGYVWRHRDFPELPRVAATAAHRIGVLLAALAPVAGLLPSGWRRRFQYLVPRDERYLHSFACFRSGDMAALFEPDCAATMIEALRDNVVQRCLDTAPGQDQLERKLYTDIKTTLVSEMLTKVDRMTMAHGLEARVPFLDHHLVEWAFRVPSGYKLRAAEGKLLVKKAMEPYLPTEILYRPKQGFNVPMKLWMRGALREFVCDSLSGARFAGRGLYRAARVTALLDDHFSGRVDASNKIFALLMLELWYQKFVDGRRECLAEAPAPGLQSLPV
jgi:asparagine synthase (glutamine-hydrolysing)